jgi:radical SAM superfamily enzyme YgiQ (UPF0313 family)
MKLALVRPPDSNKSIASEIIQHPINLAMLAACAERKGIECAIWDFSVEEYSVPIFEDRLESFQPDAVGFTCPTPHIKSGHQLAVVTKRKSADILTVVGGPHVSSVPERTMAEFPSFDVGVIGEGEHSLVDLLLQWKREKNIQGVPGTVTRVNGIPKIASPREKIMDLDLLPFPNRDLLLMERYDGSSSPGLSNRRLRITELFTTRGCPADCIFCANTVLHGRTVRQRKPEMVMREVRQCIEKYTIEHFTIDDDNFTIGKNRVIALCDGFRELPVTWDCDSRVDTVDEEMLERMAESGCVKIAFGVESGSPRMLKLICKDINIDKVKRIFRYARDAGMKTSAFFMIGSHPSETLSEIEMTARLMRELAPDFAMVYCAVPYPGTELYRLLKSNRFILSDDWDEYDVVRGRPVWRTENFTPNDLVRLQQKLYRSHYLRPGFVLARVMEIRSIGDIAYLAKNGLRLLSYVYTKDRFQRQ